MNHFHSRLTEINQIEESVSVGNEAFYIIIIYCFYM